MSLTVVIAAYNEEVRLPRCLEALGREIDADTEVIVADDGSTDATAAVAEAALPAARILRLPHRGPGAARNAAVAEASGDRIAFLDADCVPRRGWVEAVRDGRDEGVGAGRVLAEPRFCARLLALAQFGEFVGEVPRDLDNFALLNAAGPADLFRRFPIPEIASAEDRLVSWRMSQAGVPIRFEPAQAVLHAPPPGSLLERQASYARRFVRVRRDEPSLPGSGLLRWGPLGAPVAAAGRLARDLSRLAASRRPLGIPVYATPAYAVALAALRLFDAFVMARETLR